MDVLSELLSSLRLKAEVFLHATFCDRWAVDLGEEPGASFHVVGAGDCWLHRPNRPPVPLHAHDVVFLPGNAPHLISHSPVCPGADTPRNEPATRVVQPSTTLLCGRVEFLVGAWNPLLDALSEYVIIPRDRGGGSLGHVVAAMVNEAEEHRQGVQTALDRLADMLFLEILRMQVRFHPGDSFLAAIGDPRIGSALTEFHRAVDRHWRLDTLAQVAGMSRSAFAARFQQLVGMPPMRYVTRWRMHHGRRLLMEEEASVADIACRCGYASEDAFAKALKKEFGRGVRTLRRRSVAMPATMVSVDPGDPSLVPMVLSPAEVQQRRDTKPVAVLDLRDPDAYAAGHIPGASNVPLTRLRPQKAERLEETHRRMAAVLSRAGVESTRAVVLYHQDLAADRGGACSGWFRITLHGHPNVAILDGGYQRWRAEGYPLSQEPVSVVPGRTDASIRQGMLATSDEVLAALEDPLIRLLDTRDEIEWAGRLPAPGGAGGSRGAPRSGRIPSARWVEWTSFLRRSQKGWQFRPAEEIRALCARVGASPDDQILLYSFAGGRAAVAYVALSLAGFRHVRNYWNGWYEWSRVPHLPVAAARLPSLGEPDARAASGSAP